MTRTSPESAHLKNCECGHMPIMFRASLFSRDLWVIACPECGRQMHGTRVEGMGLDGYSMVDVTKTGDCFDTMVNLWNQER